jgi:predicted transcriptional regulator
MKARTMRIAKGEEKPVSGDPKVWFTSTKSFAKVLSAGGASSNLSRTLKTMESYGLVRLEPGHGRKLAPKMVHDRVELALPLIDRAKPRKTMGGRP